MTSKKAGTPKTSNKKLPAREPIGPVDSPNPRKSEGALVEHYRGEAHAEERTGSVGSLEEETLDEKAPFNKTYGLRDK